jgi:sodium/hydrogen antiporter
MNDESSSVQTFNSLSNMTLVAIFVATIFVVSLISGRLVRSVVTMPIIFTVVGALAGIALSELPKREDGQQAFLALAEAGLVLLLFTDASRTNLQVLKGIRNLPLRLLSVGLVLTVLFGWLSASMVFRQLTIWEAAILAAILAPTDAGLGQIIVTSPRVPMKIREALNVEAGLNDGLSVPLLLFFIALAGNSPENERAQLTHFVVEQLGYGTLIGVGIGLAGGWLLGLSQRRNWSASSWQQLGVVTLPLLCGLASEVAGASMFIAAFVAGLAVQVGFKHAGKHSVEFAEQWGQLLNLSVFFLFGLLISQHWSQFNYAHATYAILSLTIVRMVPVAIALIGSRLSRSTVLFIGWFGPRGLASIVLGLVYVEHVSPQPGDSTIQLAVMATVLLSICAHGLTATPGINLYARNIHILPASAPEFESADGIQAG